MTWGPLFALVGWFAEVSLGGRPQVWLWVSAGAGLFLVSALWVHARRRFLSVRVADGELRQGAERLPVAWIAEVGVDAPPPGARVLGGGFDVPRKYTQVPLRLDDDTVVLAWARDGEALRDALRKASRRPEEQPWETPRCD